MFRPKTPDYNVGADLEFEEYAPQLRTLRPRLRPDAEVTPQTFQGETWFVIQNPVSLQYYRVGAAEREILSRLDGATPLDAIHEALQRNLGNAAPSFRDVAQFIFMLRQANLLTPEASEESYWDVERATKRRRQRLKQKFSNFMYLTLPLLDPDRFLRAALPHLMWCYTRAALAVWLAVVAGAAFAFAYNFSAFVQPANRVLAPGNLGYLYVAFVLVKAFHEFGHALTARRFGAEVHRMGIMFLVFMPVPYVDVTPMWACPRKGAKILVGCGGVMIELFLASLAVFAWLALEPSVVRTVLYNVIFVASVSTLLFNGNPLLRYDAYYVLSDLIEIPNLRQRAWKFISHCLKKYLIGQKLPPYEGTAREKRWFVGYGVLSMIYRTVVVTGIILYIASKLFMVGVILACFVAVLWVVVPLGKLLKYVLFDSATRNVRARAVGVTALIATLAVLGLGVMPVPYGVRTPCAVEPGEMRVLRADWRGFLDAVAVRDGEQVASGQVLARLRNDNLDFEIRQIEARIRQAEARWRMMQTRNVAAAQAMEGHLDALRKDFSDRLERRAALTFHAPFAGVVVAPSIARVHGRFLEAGDPLLTVAAAEELRVTAVVDTGDIADVRNAVGRPVRIKFRSHPHEVLTGVIERVHPSATHEPPAAALTSLGGGPVLMDPQSGEQQRTLLPWYRVDILLDADQTPPPLGATGTARFVAGRMPLGRQLWIQFRRVLHRRFLI